MKHDHRFNAPVYVFRGGERAPVRFDVPATDEHGDKFALEVKDVSTFGFIAASTRLPVMGEGLSVRFPGLDPQRARVVFADGHWAAYCFEHELDWAVIAQNVAGPGAPASRAAAA